MLLSHVLEKNNSVTTTCEGVYGGGMGAEVRKGRGNEMEKKSPFLCVPFSSNSRVVRITIELELIYSLTHTSSLLGLLRKLNFLLFFSLVFFQIKISESIVPPPPPAPQS